MVGLRYDAAAVDGRRLVASVRVAGSKPRDARATVPDWILVPTARFAATDQDAAFTLFGEVLDAVRGEQVTEAGGRLLNYHDAFKNTLLGLRLFQSDVLILYPQSADLPKGDGRYLLGHGELAPDVIANRSRIRSIQQEFATTGFPFRSYVIGDYQQKVVFAEVNGDLALTGSPYWHCWRVRDLGELELDQALKQARDKAKRKLLGEVNQGKYPSSDERQQRYDELVDDDLSQRLVVMMPEFSRKLSDRIRQLAGVNPAVYDALTSTMRLAAFFRHAKKKDPAGYATFVQSMQGVAVGPELQTPTTLQ
jgi:hypothetical protein